MTTRRAFCLGCALASASAHALKVRDQSTGVSFPSTVSATIENPAALGSMDESLAEIVVLVDDDMAGYGGVAKKIGPVGLGVDVRRLSEFGGTDVTASLGAEISGAFSFGLGYSTDVEGGSSHMPFGILFEPDNSNRIGFYSDDLLFGGSYRLGIGREVSQTMTAELDVAWNSGGADVAPNDADLTVAVMYAASFKGSLKLAYTMPLSPEVDPGGGRVIFGAVFWVTKNVGLYFGYGEVGSGYALGLKIN